MFAYKEQIKILWFKLVVCSNKTNISIMLKLVEYNVYMQFV